MVTYCSMVQAVKCSTDTLQTPQIVSLAYWSFPPMM